MHDRRSDGGDEHGERAAGGERHDDRPGEDVAERGGADEREENAEADRPERKIESRRDHRYAADREVGAPHGDRAEGEVDAVGDAVDEHVGDGEERVEAAHLDGVDALLEKIESAHDTFPKATLWRIRSSF